MPSIEVTPSPRGVPGAVSDPTRISAEELTFPGAGGDHVNGYLARPADAASHPGMIVDPGGARAQRAHPRRRQPLRQHRLRRARRRPLHARRRPSPARRRASDDGAAVLDVRRDRPRRPRRRDRAPALARRRQRTSRLHRLLHGRPLHAAVRLRLRRGSTPPSTAGAASSTALRPRSTRRRSARRRR